MLKLKKVSLIFFLLGSIFLTGCDAQKIIDTISRVADAITQSAPAIKEIIDAFSGISSPTSSPTSTGQTSSNPVETNRQNASGATVTSPTDREDITRTSGSVGTTNPTFPPNVPTNLPQNSDLEAYIRGTMLNFSHSQVGTASNLSGASTIRSRYGITLLNGKSWSTPGSNMTPGEWTASKISSLERILSRLPAKFRTCTSAISMQGRIISRNGGGDIAGLGFDPVIISAGQTSDASTFQHVVVHEMVHQFQARYPDIARFWAHNFWPNGNRPIRPSISNYGNVSATEDMAECVANFFNNPDRLRRHDPERFRFIEQYVAN